MRSAQSIVRKGQLQDNVISGVMARFRLSLAPGSAIDSSKPPQVSRKGCPVPSTTRFSTSRFLLRLARTSRETPPQSMASVL